MEYEVTIEFDNRTITKPKTFKTLNELGLYLERVPSMIGFEINHTATIKLNTKYPAALQSKLPLGLI